MEIEEIVMDTDEAKKKGGLPPWLMPKGEDGKDGKDGDGKGKKADGKKPDGKMKKAKK